MASGLLGFVQLSQACRRLDQACNGGGDIGAALAGIWTLRDVAVAQADGLLAASLAGVPSP